MDRPSRMKLIGTLIRSEWIGSQEELLQRLASKGCVVTQATLSRDLKHLGVGKVSAGSDGYRYAFVNGAEPGEGVNDYMQDLLRGWIGVSFSGNIAVVRTHSGHADSVAIALDNLELEPLLGTVAGDDTIVAILKQEATHEQFLASLRAKVPGIV